LSGGILPRTARYQFASDGHIEERAQLYGLLRHRTPITALKHHASTKGTHCQRAQDCGGDGDEPEETIQ